MQNIYLIVGGGKTHNNLYIFENFRPVFRENEGLPEHGIPNAQI